MAQAIEVKIFDLYQNGNIFQLPSGSTVLLRDRLPVKQFEEDKQYIPNNDDELPLLVYAQNQRKVANAEKYWWLLADRNNCFDPLRRQFVGDDGIVQAIDEVTVDIPDILKQKIEFS